MKVIQVNIFEKAGSTGAIVKAISDELLLSGSESFILYGLGAKSKDKNSFRILSNWNRMVNILYTYFSGYMYAGSLQSTLKAIRKIKKIKPDIVHIHCANGHMLNFYVFFKYLKKHNINYVITNHAEFYYTGSYPHVPDNSTQWIDGKREKINNAKKLTNSLFFDKTFSSLHRLHKSLEGSRSIAITSVSPWVLSRSRSSFILSSFPNYLVENGVNISIFNFTGTIIQDIKDKADGKNIILYVTSDYNNPIKGTNFFIELAEAFIDKHVFVLAGTDQKDIVLPKNVLNLGKISDKSYLSALYSTADITLITSKRETFSLVVAESLCCGTPVVGFLSGGPESIAIDEYCRFTEYGNIDNIKNSIEELIKKKYSKKVISSKALVKYNQENMVNSYLAIYKKLIEKNKN